MRWKDPRYGDRRTVTKFLWFPLQIGKETRWFEMATIEQRYIDGGCYGDDEWRSMAWVETDYEKNFLKKVVAFLKLFTYNRRRKKETP